MIEITILHGPPASGKTLNSQAIAQALRTDCTVDGWDLAELEEIAADHANDCPPFRILVITTDPDLNDPRAKKKTRMEGNRISITEAKGLLGPLWIEPIQAPGHH